MKLIAVVGVKDEADLLERLIAHLRAINVDQIIVRDMYSSDETPAILERYRSERHVCWVRMSDQESREAWATGALALARSTGADWAMFIDADEFPIPASGSIKDCAALAHADAVTLERYNIPLSHSGPMVPDGLDPDKYEELLLLVDPIPEFWTRIKEDFNLSWMRSGIAPRVLARPQLVTDLTLGGHDVIGADPLSLRRETAKDLVVAHLPFTTRARFARKVENIRSFFSTHDQLYGDQYALHWRRWVAIADEGTLDREFDRMIFDDATIRELRQERIIRSAAELFRDRMISGGG